MAYKLNSSIPSLTDLGSPVQSAAIDYDCMFEYLGKKYWVLGYWGPYCQWVVCNLTDSKIKIYTALDTGERPQSFSSIFHNGFLYVGKNDPICNLHKIDIVAETITSLGTPPSGGKYFGHVSVYNAATDKIYMTAMKINAGLSGYEAHLFSIDPTTDAMVEIGTFHGLDTETEMYVYTMGVNAAGTYAYAGMQRNPNYLSILRIADGVKFVFFLEDGDAYAGQGIKIRKSDGAIYYKRQLSNLSYLWYEFATDPETPTPCAAQTEADFWESWRSNGTLVNSPDFFETAYGVVTNNGLAYPTNIEGHWVGFMYQFTGGIWNYLWLKGTLFSVGAADYSEMLPSPVKDALLLMLRSYQPFFHVFKDGSTELCGAVDYSLYDLMLAPNGKYYFSGYTAATFEFDPSQPWTYPFGDNPRKLNLSLTQYHYYQAWTNDGCLWINAVPRTGDADRKIGWINVDTGVNGSYQDVYLVDSESTQNGACSVDNYNRVVFGVRDWLYVFHKDDKTAPERTITVTGAYPDNTVLAPADIGNGCVLAAIRGATSALFKVNCLTGEIVDSVEISGTLFGTIRNTQYRLILGPDGYVWACVAKSGNNVLCRWNVETLVEEEIKGSLAKCYQVAFNKGDCYLYV